LLLRIKAKKLALNCELFKLSNKIKSHFNISTGDREKQSKILAETKIKFIAVHNNQRRHYISNE